MKSTKACYFCAISVFLLLKLCPFVFVFAMFIGNVKKILSSAFRPSCYPSVFVVVFVFVFAMLVGNVRKVLSVFRPSCYPSVFGGKGPGRCRCRSSGYFSDDMRVFYRLVENVSNFTILSIDKGFFINRLGKVSYCVQSC